MVLAGFANNHASNSPVRLDTFPFPHAIIDNFFIPAQAHIISNYFNQILARGLSKWRDKDKFSLIQNYDGYSYIPHPISESLLNTWYSPEWVAYWSEIFNVQLSPDVLLEFHHHPPGSKRSVIHRDFNAVSLKEEPLANGINAWYFDGNYFDPDRGKNRGYRTVMRCISLIYYINNSPELEGGETGIYEERGDEYLKKTIEPINNRMLAFRLSPLSYHRYMGNNTLARNSITQFLHVAL